LPHLCWITAPLWSFGSASALLQGNKEAANSRMTFTLYNSPCHFLDRFDCWSGVLHRLS
jgi:hypothetical protein